MIKGRIIKRYEGRVWEQAVDLYDEYRAKRDGGRVSVKSGGNGDTRTCEGGVQCGGMAALLWTFVHML